MSNDEILAELSLEERTAANLLGVSAADLVRDFRAEFEQLSPEEQAEFERVIDKANEVLPAMHATLDRIEKQMAQCSLALREVSAQTSSLSDRISRIEELVGINASRDHH